MAARARRPLLHYTKVAALPRTAPTSPPLRLIGALGLLFVLAGFALLGRELVTPPRAAPAAGPAEYVVYAEFGLTADTVYRADAARPLAWLRNEDGADPARIEVRLTLWPGGDESLLAEGHHHGRRIAWQGAAAAQNE